MKRHTLVDLEGAINVWVIDQSLPCMVNVSVCRHQLAEEGKGRTSYGRSGFLATKNKDVGE